MEMFNEKVREERLWDLEKNESLYTLKPVEKYAIERIKSLGIEHSYDVIANEVPYFKTIGYTEFAGTFIFQPLNFDFREKMIEESFYEGSKNVLDYASFFRNNINNNNANKYQHRKQEFDKHPPKNHIVVLPGSNKIKDRICLNKLEYIHEEHKGDVYFKPHPVSSYQTVGELMDKFGEDNVLDKNTDLYYYLPKTKKIYTTHLSESALYGVILGIKIEPIDVYNSIEGSSFYNINKLLFDYQHLGDDLINKTFSNYKSGFVNPILDSNWKKTINKYLDYAQKYRLAHKNWFIIKDRKKENCKDCEEKKKKREAAKQN